MGIGKRRVLRRGRVPRTGQEREDGQDHADDDKRQSGSVTEHPAHEFFAVRHVLLAHRGRQHGARDDEVTEHCREVAQRMVFAGLIGEVGDRRVRVEHDDGLSHRGDRSHVRDDLLAGDYREQAECRNDYERGPGQPAEEGHRDRRQVRKGLRRGRDVAELALARCIVPMHETLRGDDTDRARYQGPEAGPGEERNDDRSERDSEEQQHADR